jgi:two-component system chemotaxis response regulator CheY
MRIMEKRMLSTLPDIQFAEAVDGVEALSVIAAEPGGFDVILIDWNMPNMDGITLVQKIREKDKKTALIMATTEGEKNHVMDAIRAGVNNYIVKPFAAASLIEKFSATLAKSKAA